MDKMMDGVRGRVGGRKAWPLPLIEPPLGSLLWSPSRGGGGGGMAPEPLFDSSDLLSNVCMHPIRH